MRRIILRMCDGDYNIEFDPETQKTSIYHTGPSNYV